MKDRSRAKFVLARVLARSGTHYADAIPKMGSARHRSSRVDIWRRSLRKARPTTNTRLAVDRTMCVSRLLYKYPWTPPSGQSLEIRYAYAVRPSHTISLSGQLSTIWYRVRDYAGSKHSRWAGSHSGLLCWSSRTTLARCRLIGNVFGR